ncbi:MAG TPA: NAD(P)/FAD-dependent oxidoreductase [Chitinophagaceae bacterium]|nr:NAD(P)/FAD-dependent oxidoreductase [Chitinophagaceae bacterium]
MSNKKKLVVVGGGAAGFFCAVNAARLNPALQVTIVEKSNKLLSKVKVSGGGRCNVTHACFEIGELVRQYPRGQNFLKKAFHWFNTNDTVAWFEGRGVKLKMEADGRMFPVTDSSQTIIDCLLREADRYGVKVLVQTEIKRIEHDGDGFMLHTNASTLTADFLCIACGGYSKAAHFDWLKQTGHSIEDPVPSLFTFNMPGNAITKLMGVNLPGVTIKIAGSKLQQTGPVLITHWGLSGPVVLKLSAWAARELAACSYQFSVIVHWLAKFSERELREEIQELRNAFGSQRISARNSFGIPSRLWLYFLAICHISEGLNWADLPAKQQQQLIQVLSGQVFNVSGKTTYKEEFVTCGGIKLSEIEANSMQSKIIPKLFFAGEIMDVDGVTGGFNFQHAWTSGFIAAQAIAQNS